MVKTQVQFPDELFREAKRVAGEQEMSFAKVDEKGVEGSLLAEDLADADGANEGGQDHGDEDEGAEKGFAGEKETVGNPGEGQGEEQGEGGGEEGEEEGVAQALEVDGVAKDLEEVGEGEVTVAVEEGAAEGLADGEEEEAGEDAINIGGVLAMSLPLIVTGKQIGRAHV